MRHSGRGGRLPDPQWKQGPPEPKHSHSDHDLDIQPADWDIDGVGQEEAMKVDSQALFAIQELRVCRREGCDAEQVSRFIYTWKDVPMECMAAIRDAVDSFDQMVEYAATHVEVTDGGPCGPIATITVGDDAFDGIAATEVFVDEPYGRCNGYTPPEPDIDAHRYDL